MSTEEKFEAAVDVINSIPYDGTFEPSEEMLLKLYAYEKQATEGPCLEPKPFVWNVAARAKWSTWNELADMSKEAAMEHYVKELTKVIETMSYSEKTSRFISLIGPFYEAISEETDSLHRTVQEIGNFPSTSMPEDSVPPTLSELYNVSKNRYEPILNSKPDSMTKKLHLPDSLARKYSNYSSSSDSSNFDVLSDLSGDEFPLSEKNLTFSKANRHRNQSFLSEKDIIVLSLMNLQSRLEGILKRLNAIHLLAETSNFQSEKPCDGWSLHFSGTAFALLWPFVVELCFNTFRG